MSIIQESQPDYAPLRDFGDPPIKRVTGLGEIGNADDLFRSLQKCDIFGLRPTDIRRKSVYIPPSSHFGTLLYQRSITIIEVCDPNNSTDYELRTGFDNTSFSLIARKGNNNPCMVNCSDLLTMGGNPPRLGYYSQDNNFLPFGINEDGTKQGALIVIKTKQGFPYFRVIPTVVSGPWREMFDTDTGTLRPSKWKDFYDKETATYKPKTPEISEEQQKDTPEKKLLGIIKKTLDQNIIPWDGEVDESNLHFPGVRISKEASQILTKGHTVAGIVPIAIVAPEGVVDDEGTVVIKSETRMGRLQDDLFPTWHTFVTFTLADSRHPVLKKTTYPQYMELEAPHLTEHCQVLYNSKLSGRSDFILRGNHFNLGNEGGKDHLLLLVVKPQGPTMRNPYLIFATQLDLPDDLLPNVYQPEEPEQPKQPEQKKSIEELFKPTDSAVKPLTVNEVNEKMSKLPDIQGKYESDDHTSPRMGHIPETQTAVMFRQKPLTITLFGVRPEKTTRWDKTQPTLADIKAALINGPRGTHRLQFTLETTPDKSLRITKVTLNEFVEESVPTARGFRKYTHTRESRDLTLLHDINLLSQLVRLVEPGAG